MEVKHIQELYKYNRWANGRVLDAVSKLTTDDFTKEIRSSFPSVRDTLVHILSAEWIWLMRWKGTSPKAMLSSIDYPKISELKSRWHVVEREQREFVSRTTVDSLQKKITYTNTTGEQWTYALWQMMQHVVNHSTYHRGQITTMLRQLGAKTEATDFLVFYGEKSEEMKIPE